MKPLVVVIAKCIVVLAKCFVALAPILFAVLFVWSGLYCRYFNYVGFHDTAGQYMMICSLLAAIICTAIPMPAFQGWKAAIIICFLVLFMVTFVLRGITGLFCPL